MYVQLFCHPILRAGMLWFLQSPLLRTRRVDFRGGATVVDSSLQEAVQEALQGMQGEVQVFDCAEVSPRQQQMQMHTASGSPGKHPEELQRRLH